MKKHMIVGILLISPFYFMVAFPPLIQASADALLTVGNGSGYPGSPNNVVEVSLDNYYDIVIGLQVDITDEGDHLTCTGCTPNPDRASQFNCFASEMINGSCRAVLLTFNPAEGIQTGFGPLLSIDYAIKENASAGECRTLNPEEVKVAGENFLDFIEVPSYPGEFCFLTCQNNADCNDANECTNDTCSSGQCVHECNVILPSDPCCSNPACFADSVCSDPSDTDHDGIPNGVDNCPNTYNFSQTNHDNDSYGNACDNCFRTDNEDQADADGNGIGDACEDIACGDVWPPESSSGAMDCGDGLVDIYDLIAEIDFILGVQPDACQEERANVPTGEPPFCIPQDESINIFDSLVLVDKTLHKPYCLSFFFTCSDNEDCNDGLFCTGVETCVSGVCLGGPDPCPGQLCNETNKECIDYCLTDLDCDDGSFCNGIERCDSESDTCQPGDGNPCSSGTQCNEATDTCDPIATSSIPTLSEWGIIIFMTIILGIGVVMMYRRRML